LVTPRQIAFETTAACLETRARTGILKTAHGEIETPVFMPVGTQATVKGVRQDSLYRELGARILLGNTYHLFLRPGHEIIRELGGLHRFMSWPGAILTDSGGFQVFSLSERRTISDDGVVFRSHLDGDSHLFTPESTVDVQLALGSDILMTLDECTPYPSPRDYAETSTARTIEWARRAMTHFRQRMESVSTRHALFPIVQGSVYTDLRQSCATQLADLDADGYAIGGLSVGEPRPLSMDMVDAAEPRLPRDRPRYAMGVGMPDELPEYVARGIDMMDCVLPTRNARNGYLFTRRGRLIIKHSRFKADPEPIDDHCGCPTCRTYSRAYLRHLFQAGEILYATLATTHNLYRYLEIMREIRDAIRSGTFPQYLAETRSAANQRVE
jgi:queuine tRNA-ribosyltransferase